MFFGRLFLRFGGVFIAFARVVSVKRYIFSCRLNDVQVMTIRLLTFYALTFERILNEATALCFDRDKINCKDQSNTHFRSFTLTQSDVTTDT